MDHAADAHRTDLMTLTRFVLNEQSKYPESRGDFSILLSHIVLGCKFVCSAVNKDKKTWVKVSRQLAQKIQSFGGRIYRAIGRGRDFMSLFNDIGIKKCGIVVETRKRGKLKHEVDKKKPGLINVDLYAQYIMESLKQ